MATRKHSKIRTHTFQYEGFDASHVRVTGEISAMSMAQARNLLAQKKISVLKIKKKFISPFRFMFRSKVKSQEITMFTRQMATLAAAGIPLVQSFGVVSETLGDTALNFLIQRIKADVESGTTFSQALKKYPNNFDNLYCSLIEAGEQSGNLDTMLDRLATYYEKIDALMRKVKKALYYPIAVVIVAIIVTTILLVKVVPTFQEVFASFGAELPFFTRVVVHISDLLQHYGLYILIALILLFYLFIHLYRKNIAFRNTIQRLMLRIPILGSILQKTAIARFARTLSTTTKAGVPLSDALDTAASASGNIVYSRAIQKIKDGLVAGQQMRTMIKATGVFPPLVVQMVSIGEESGALDDMLGKIANLFEDEVDTQVDGLTSLLEPIIMVVLGIIVGGIVIAMYLPIFQMGNIV